MHFLPRFLRNTIRLLSLIGLLLYGSGSLVGKADELGPVADHANRSSYQIQAGLGGELYPVLANYASLQKPAERTLASITVIATNPTATVVRERIAVQVRGWSDQEIQNVDLAPGASQQLLFA